MFICILCMDLKQIFQFICILSMDLKQIVAPQVIYLARSADATCQGLVSATDAATTMTLNRGGFFLLNLSNFFQIFFL